MSHETYVPRLARKSNFPFLLNLGSFHSSSLQTISVEWSRCMFMSPGNTVLRLFMYKLDNYMYNDLCFSVFKQCLYAVPAAQIITICLIGKTYINMLTILLIFNSAESNKETSRICYFLQLPVWLNKPQVRWSLICYFNLHLHVRHTCLL